MRDIEYESGIGEGLVFEIMKELEIWYIFMLKVYGFWLDGVLVMIGLDKGVSGRLNKLNFYILNIVLVLCVV